MLTLNFLWGSEFTALLDFTLGFSLLRSGQQVALRVHKLLFEPLWFPHPPRPRGVVWGVPFSEMLKSLG